MYLQIQQLYNPYTHMYPPLFAQYDNGDSSSDTVDGRNPKQPPGMVKS